MQPIPPMLNRPHLYRQLLGLALLLALATGVPRTVVTWDCTGEDEGQCSLPAGLSGVTALAVGFGHSLALPQPIRFGVIGDFGKDTPSEGEVANLLAGQSVGFIVTVGDNRYGAITYDRAVGRYYCNYLTAVTAGTYCAGGNSPVNAFFPATGNHDYSDGLGGGINEYLDYFTLPGNGIATSGTSGSERYYDIIQGPVHFFFIDSQAAIGDATDRAVQQAWLQGQLAASMTRWQVVVLHHAPYSSGGHGSNLRMQWPYASWGADVVLAGHDHTYERIFQDGIVYFVNGLGESSREDFNTPVACSQVRHKNDFGAMIVEADLNAMTFRFLNRLGVEIDSYTLGSGDSSPTVSSICRASANPTHAASVDFTVTLDESVSGVDTDDFALTPSGVTGASVTSVSGSSALYTVTLNTGNGDGTLRLDLIDDDSIHDLAGNPLGGTGTGNFTTGEVYTVDKTLPTPDLRSFLPLVRR